MFFESLLPLMLNPEAAVTTQTFTTCVGRRVRYESFVTVGARRPPVGTLVSGSELRIDGATVFFTEAFEGKIAPQPPQTSLEFSELRELESGDAKKYSAKLKVNAASTVVEDVLCEQRSVSLDE